MNEVEAVTNALNVGESIASEISSVDCQLDAIAESLTSIEDTLTEGVGALERIATALEAMFRDGLDVHRQS